MTKALIQKAIITAAIGMTAFAGGTFSAPGTAEAATQRIDCPLPQIRREVTTRLPDGWWNTPIVNRLTETKIQTIGGKKALICKYGAAGTIQRYAPAGATCRKNDRGFVCETRSASAPRTHSTGGINLKQTFTADLDNGRTGGGGADIWFQAETRDLLYITPRGRAKIGVGNRRNRGRDGCARARYTNSRVSLRDIPVGSYICVKTNEGRISQFRVNALTGSSPKTLKIGYTTWQ
ncbi:MAG: hypothetical protein AAF557_20365 [Pseudomonadota bacterium]